MIFYKQVGRKRTPKWRGRAIASDFDETGVAAKTFKIERFCARKWLVTPPDSPVEGEDVEELVREGGNADAPLDEGVPPEPCMVTGEVPAGAPVGKPMPDGEDLWRFISGRSGVSGMPEDLLKTAQPLTWYRLPRQPRLMNLTMPCISTLV